jgi:hypothetical protein
MSSEQGMWMQAPAGHITTFSTAHFLECEGFVKGNVIGHKYMKIHRQIKFCYGSKGKSNSHILQYSRGCTRFLASLEMFHLLHMWNTAENMLMPVFSD